MKDREAAKNCPFCNRELAAGTVSSGGAKFLSAIPGDVHFTRADGRDEIVLGRHDTRTAWLCDDCGSFVVKGDFAD